MTLLTLTAAGQPTTYLAEVKAIQRAEQLAVVRQRLREGDQGALLLTTRLPPVLAQVCKDMDLQFIDTEGNAYLRRPGLFVYVTGKGKAQPPLTPMGLTTTAALKMAFVLLCRPDALDLPFRQLGAMAGVALGAVGRVLNDLDKRGYIVGGTKRGVERRLVEPARLLDDWTANYAAKLRPTLVLGRYRAGRPDWWKQLQPAEYQALWGGEVAADRLTRHLRPARQQIYLAYRPDYTEVVRRLIVAGHLAKDPAGDVEVLKAFWEFTPEPTHPDLTPPVLVYADLMATLDPRNIEVAGIIRKQYIDGRAT